MKISEQGDLKGGLRLKGMYEVLTISVSSVPQTLAEITILMV
jgi:hypothetical protein